MIFVSSASITPLYIWWKILEWCWLWWTNCLPGFMLFFTLLEAPFSICMHQFSISCCARRCRVGHLALLGTYMALQRNMSKSHGVATCQRVMVFYLFRIFFTWSAGCAPVQHMSDSSCQNRVSCASIARFVASGLYKCNFVASILWRKSSYIVLCKSAFFKHCTQFLSDMSKTYACWILQAGQNVTQSLQTSVITGNSFRSFWLVYSSIDICKLKQNIQLPIVNALQGWLVVWLSMWHTSNFQVLDLKSKISK